MQRRHKVTSAQIMEQTKEFVEEEDYQRIPREKDPLYLYLKQISNYPLLTGEDEKTIGHKISDLKNELHNLKQQNIDDQLHPIEYNHAKTKLEKELIHHKNKMINSNLRLVISIAKKYQHRGLSFLDLIILYMLLLQN